MGIIQGITDYFLLSKKERANKPDEEGLRPLFYAAQKGDLDEFKSLIEDGADVNHLVSKKEGSLAHVLVRFNRLSMLNEALKAGLKLEEIEGVSSLMQLAVKNDNKEMIRFLANHGVKTDNAACLEVAIAKKDKDLMALLIQKGANLNMSTRRGMNKNEGLTALFFTDYYGENLLSYAYEVYPECIPLLIEGKADVNAIGQNGETFLHLLVKKGDLALLEQCLKLNPDFNKEDKNGKTPLDYAYEGKTEIHLKMRTLMMEHGGKVGLTEKIKTDSFFSIDRDAYELAKAIYKQDNEMVSLLLKSGANPNSFVDIFSLFEMAIRHDDADFVRVFFEKEQKTRTISPDKKDFNTLKKMTNSERYALLSECGIDMKSLQGKKSFLSLAIANQDVPLVQALLAAKADPNKKEEFDSPSGKKGMFGFVSEWKMPIQQAFETGNKDIFKLLLEAGADVNNPISSDGNFALISAIEKKDTEAIDLLLKHQALIICDKRKIKSNAIATLVSKKDVGLLMKMLNQMQGEQTKDPNLYQEYLSAGLTLKDDALIKASLLKLTQCPPNNENVENRYQLIAQALKQGRLDIANALLDNLEQGRSVLPSNKLLKEIYVSGGNTFFVKFLTKMPDLETKVGDDVLKQAMKDGQFDIAEALMDKNCNIQFGKGNGILHSALLGKKLELVERIISHPNFLVDRHKNEYHLTDEEVAYACLQDKSLTPQQKEKYKKILDVLKEEPKSNTFEYEISEVHAYATRKTEEWRKHIEGKRSRIKKESEKDSKLGIITPVAETLSAVVSAVGSAVEGDFSGAATDMGVGVYRAVTAPINVVSETFEGKTAIGYEETTTDIANKKRQEEADEIFQAELDRVSKNVYAQYYNEGKKRVLEENRKKKEDETKELLRRVAVYQKDLKGRKKERQEFESSLSVDSTGSSLQPAVNAVLRGAGEVIEDISTKQLLEREPVSPAPKRNGGRTD